MRRFVRDNSLSITLCGLFVVFLLLQSITGWRTSNQDNQEHRQPTQSYGSYLTSAHFVEATAENWESEFLQMASYVVLTALLIQRGSPESKDPDAEEPVDEDPRQARERGDAPGPARRAGARAVRALPVAGAGGAVSDRVHVARPRRPRRVQPAATRARSGADLADRVRDQRPVLVPVVPELAERVPGRLRGGGARHLPAPARLTGVQAGRRAARQDRKLLTSAAPAEMTALSRRGAARRDGSPCRTGRPPHARCRPRPRPVRRAPRRRVGARRHGAPRPAPVARRDPCSLLAVCVLNLAGGVAARPARETVASTGAFRVRRGW